MATVISVKTSAATMLISQTTESANSSPTKSAGTALGALDSCAIHIYPGYQLVHSC